jgi:8-oxo-dGTP pyrophosphatase MutT (NUDIX family)
MTERTVFAGKIFSIIWDEHTTPNGDKLVFETVSAPDVVRVYPLYGNQILLIREHRHELGREILRTVSGRIEGEESPERAAERELREEIGATASGSYVFAVSQPILKVRSRVHHVLTRVKNIGPAAPEPGERIRAAPFDISDLESLAWSGDILEDIIAFQLLRLSRNSAQLIRIAKR